MRPLYMFGLAAILLTGITALSLGGLENITGAFTQSIGRFSPGGFYVNSLELKVYNAKPSYPSEECNLTLYSGAEDIVQETGSHAAEVYFKNPGWTANIPGAKWIWKSPYVENPARPQTYTFVREFNWTGEIDSATLLIASDNSYEVRINDRLIGRNLSANNYGYARSYNVKIPLQPGANTIKITVRNFAGSSDPTPGAAGLLYKLEIKKSGCVSCETRVACTTIYNFTDTKPGDNGLDIFRFDISGSDAWACVFIKNKADLENNLTEPEMGSGDTTQGKWQGELSQFMNFFAWIDNDTSMTYSPGDTYLFRGNLSEANPKFSISDSAAIYRTPIPAGAEKLIGVYWCFGDITGIGTYSLGCDGSRQENNKAQTDILKMDFIFYAFQSSGNPGFRCNQSIIM